MLLAGARGEGYAPGEYRRVPNWIGPPGCGLEDARFVPIAADGLPDAMSTWERYIHEEVPDRLVLLAVSRDDDWTGWARFFLEALGEQAEDNLKKARGILDLYEKMKNRVMEITRSQYAILALDWIFERPIFSASHFRNRAGIPTSSVQRILVALREGEILRVIVPASGRQASVLVFPELLNIAEGRDVF